MKSFFRLSLPLLAAGALLCGFSLRANAQWNQTEDVSFSWLTSSADPGVSATHDSTTATLSFSNPFNVNPDFGKDYEIDTYRRYNS